MKIGDEVKIINNIYSDYGYLLGKIGKIKAGGALHRNVRRWLVDFGNNEIHVFEPDLQ